MAARRDLVLAAALVLLAAACVTTQTVKPMTEDELKAKREAAQQSYSIGQGYFAQNNLGPALENFEAALAADSSFYEAYVAIGIVYKRMRDPVQSEDFFRRAIARDPMQAKAYEGLGDLFVELGRLEDAERVYSEGLSRDPSLVDLYNGLAEVFVKRGQMSRADSLYKIALARFPDEVSVQRLWSEFLIKQGRHQEAADALVPLVRRFPTVDVLREKLAISYVELKKYPEALAQFDTLLVTNPGNTYYLLQQGVILARQGRSRQAIEKFDAVIRADTTKPDGHNYKGDVYVQQNNLDAAEASYRRALARDPGNAQASVGIGDVYRRRADSQRGTDLSRTSTANLRSAKANYEQARSFYQRAAGDSGYQSYIRSQLDYINRAVEAVDKELFIR